LDNHFNNVTRLERNQGATLWMLLLNLGEIVRLGDELGFAAADQARREVGGRLKSIERSELSTYDIGSGNFVALIQGDLNDAQVMKIARSALTLLETPMRLGQQLASVHAFIGCVSYPHDGKDLETLLKHAEIAMFGAKNFANPICFYEAEGSSDSPSVM
jgi:diguanylate cyclase (GGDEF)-like protein